MHLQVSKTLGEDASLILRFNASGIDSVYKTYKTPGITGPGVKPRLRGSSERVLRISQPC